MSTGRVSVVAHSARATSSRRKRQPNVVLNLSLVDFDFFFLLKKLRFDTRLPEYPDPRQTCEKRCCFSHTRSWPHRKLLITNSQTGWAGSPRPRCFQSPKVTSANTDPTPFRGHSPRQKLPPSPTPTFPSHPQPVDPLDHCPSCSHVLVASEMPLAWSNHASSIDEALVSYSQSICKPQLASPH